MGPLKYLFSGVRLLTVLSITAIVGGIVLQSDDIAETARRLSDSSSHLQGWVRGRTLISQAGTCTDPMPSWPDCERIECMSDNHWACTLMKSTTGGSTGGTTGGCSGSPPTSTSQCYNGVWGEPMGGGSTGGTTGGCSGSPPTSTSWCDYGTHTWKDGTGTTGGGGYTGGSTGGSGGEWEASPAVQETCRNDCVTNGHFPLADCQIFCKDGSWSGPGGGSTGGGGTGPGCPAPQAFTTKAACETYCRAAPMSAGDSCSWACEDLNPCGPGTGGSGGGSTGGSGTWEASPEAQATCRKSCEPTHGAACTEYCKDGDWQGAGGGTMGGSGGGGATPMKNCFYPRAMINWAPTGFTVWCEGDYFNCHEGDPSGRSVSNAGLSLGAPSYCEQGWSGNSGGAGGGSDGGTPIDFGNPLQKAKCYHNKKTNELYYMNAQMPAGWIVVPKSACEDIGLRPGDSWSGGGDHEAPGEWNDHGDFGGNGDYMGDLGGYGGQGGHDGDFMMAAPAPFVDAEQLAREKKQMANELKNRAREVKDMRRSYKDSRSENASLASQIDQFESGLADIAGCFESAADFDDMRDCYDRNGEIGDLTRDIWDVLQAGNIKRDIENSGREEKNMTREIERLSRSGIDTSELQSLLADWQSARSTVLSLIDSDPQEAQYSMQDVWDAQQAFWETTQGLNWQEQTNEMERHGCKDFEREAKRMPKELQSDIEDIVAECKDLLVSVQADIESGNIEPWEAGDQMRWGMEELWQRFQEIMESQWGEQACHDVEWGLGDVERILTHEVPGIIEEVRGEHPDIADKMDSLLEKATSILNEARSDAENDDCESAMDGIDDMETQIRPRFEDLMRQAGMDPDEFEENGPDYRDIYDDFGFEDFDYEDFGAHLQDNDYGTQDINFMKRIAAQILEQYFANQKDSGGPDILKGAADLGIGSLEVQQLLETKNALLAQIEGLKSEIEGLKAELVAIADQVAQFTFGEDTAQEAEEFVKNELPHLSEEEAVERFEELKEAAGEELYADGVIPFEDTYIGEWYTDDAKVAQELGLVEGTGTSGGTELEPGSDTNVAETITMFARLIEEDIDEDAVPTSDIGTELPDWAQSYAAVLEDAGVDLDAIFKDSDPSDPATRGEVATLLSEVLELEDADLELADQFDDIDAATAAEHDAIAAVYDAGIMTGYGDSDNFGVDDALNRAALVTTLNRAHELIAGEVDHDVDGFDEEDSDEEGFDFDEESDEDFEPDFLDEEDEHDEDDDGFSDEEEEFDFDEENFDEEEFNVEEHEEESTTEEPTSVETTISGRRYQGTRPSHRGF